PCSPAAARLQDIEHVIVMIQENRSFDHYFGTYRGVIGFGDPAGRDVFAQPGYRDGDLLPFHLDTRNANGECVADPIHTWGAQHRMWNGGRMDGFVRANTAAIGAGNGPITMGYYDRNDLPFYYALADAFTICDRFFCSAIGPTDPNRLHAMSATIDPDGKAGGPVVGSVGSTTEAPRLRWTTMPERLRANGISWKVYASPDSTYVDGDNTLLFFQQYRSDPELAAGAFGATFPGTFEADVANGS